MVQYTHELNKGVVVSINTSDKVEENIVEANKYVAETKEIATQEGVEL